MNTYYGITSFLKNEYVVNINESIRVGSEVVQVGAKDADEGKNAEISYFMANPDDHFSVDAKSGFIKVTQSLKCEEDCLPCLREAKLCSLIIGMYKFIYRNVTIFLKSYDLDLGDSLMSTKISWHLCTFVFCTKPFSILINGPLLDFLFLKWYFSRVE